MIRFQKGFASFNSAKQQNSSQVIATQCQLLIQQANAVHLCDAQHRLIDTNCYIYSILKEMCR